MEEGRGNKGDGRRGTLNAATDEGENESERGGLGGVAGVVDVWSDFVCCTTTRECHEMAVARGRGNIRNCPKRILMD